MADEGCTFTDFQCRLGEGVSELMSGTLDDIVNAVLEAVGNAVVAVGTIWVRVPTPDLTGGGGSTPVEGWGSPDGTAGLETVLGYSSWISLGICVLSLMVLGVRLAFARGSDTAEQMGRTGLVLSAVILVSAAAAVVAQLMPLPGQRPGPTASAPVAMIQDSLWWYTAAVAVLSIIIGGARMAWEQRAQPGKDLAASLITLVVVTGAGLSIVATLVIAADAFSGWMLNQATACDVTDASTGCFGKNIATLFAPLQASGLGQLLVILLGFAAVIMSLIQVLLMIARAGMLVILTGILPLSAAATNTETGKQWFRKNVAWLGAAILYKPAAAIVYATAIKLMGSDWAGSETGDNPIVATMTGLVLMGLAIVALPALMRFITPLVNATAGSGGGAGAMAGAAAMALPTGAVQLAARTGGPASSSTAGSSGGAGPSGASGIGPSGPGGPTGGFGSGKAGSNGANGTGGSRGGGTANPSGAPAGGGASGAVPAAAGTGGGAAAAAAGPPGMVAAAAMQTAQQVKGTAQQIAHDAASSTGEGSGAPSGSFHSK